MPKPRKNKNEKLKVFVCAVREDERSALEIYTALLNEKTWIEPWHYKKDILPGQDRGGELEKAMMNANAVILCFSKVSVNKEGPFQSEMKYLMDIAKEVPPESIFIVPLKLDKECDIPSRYNLNDLQYLEYFTAGSKEAHETLLNSLKSRAKTLGIKVDETQPSNNPNVCSSAPRRLGELVLDEDFSCFDSHHRNITEFVLAKLLELDERSIAIKEVTLGSVKILIELPEKAYRRLDSMVKNRDRKLHRLLKVKSFGLAEKPKAEPKSTAQKLEAEELRPSATLLVGQKDELNASHSLFENPYGEKRIALILGGGGIGKTYLVREMLREVREKRIFAPEEPIDLYSTDYRHINGIQWKIIEIVEELSGLKGEQSPFAKYKRGMADTSDNFYDCLTEFCATHPLVLAFDTFENLDRVASNWLFKGDRGGLQVPGLVCIIAGREEGREKEELDEYRNNPLVKEILISSLTLQETENFYRKIESEFVSLLNDSLLKVLDMESSEPIHAAIRRIWEITKGNPLKLEMAFRWSGTLFSESSLADLTTEWYEERLMQRVREWGEQGEFVVSSLAVVQPVFDTLLCMACITRRFDLRFLQFLIDENFISFGDSGISKEHVLNYLRRYFFVKIRGEDDEGLEIIQLHDEVARLVQQYMWPYLDPSHEKRNEIYRAVVRYYDTLIEQAPPELAEVLQVEQLCYMLKLDKKGAGIQRWFELAELGNENINKLLPGEIKDHVKDYDVNIQMEIHIRIAEMEKNIYHINQALGHWDEVRKLGEAEKRDDWMVESLRGKFNCTWMADPDKALKRYLMPALEICKQRVPEKLALIYYEIGFAYRHMQELMQAGEWYEKALRQLEKYPENSSLEATLYNDAGYAYLQMGRWGDASKYSNEALHIRLMQLRADDEKLKSAGDNPDPKLRAARSRSARFAGLSNNTLGEYHRYIDDLDEALKKYNEAYKLFVEIGDYFWQAKCLCARGETYRRRGRKTWREQGVDSLYQKDFDLAREDMEQSLYLCEKYQLDDERDTANRRLGRLAHDEAMIALEKNEMELAREKLEEAYRYFQVGLEFADKTNDVLEELENLTELAFLADDAIVVFGKDEVPSHYHNEVTNLAEMLEKHEKDQRRIYWYPVFESLLKMEQAATAFAHGEYDAALEGNVEAFKGLGTFPGYGHSRYKQHFDHLAGQVKQLPRGEQEKWRKRFVEVWEHTPMPDREGKTLADDLLPDLVKWFNRLVIGPS